MRSIPTRGSGSLILVVEWKFHRLMVLGGYLEQDGDKGQDSNGDQVRNCRDEKLRWEIRGKREKAPCGSWKFSPRNKGRSGTRVIFYSNEGLKAGIEGRRSILIHVKHLAWVLAHGGIPSKVVESLQMVRWRESLEALLHRLSFGIQSTWTPCKKHRTPSLSELRTISGLWSWWSRTMSGPMEQAGKNIALVMKIV